MLRSRRWGVGPLRAHACKCLRLPPLRPLRIQRVNPVRLGAQTQVISCAPCVPERLGPRGKATGARRGLQAAGTDAAGSCSPFETWFRKGWQVPSPILSPGGLQVRVSCYPADKKQPLHQEAGAKPIKVSFRLAAESSQPAILTPSALITNFRYAQYEGSHTSLPAKGTSAGEIPGVR